MWLFGGQNVGAAPTGPTYQGRVATVKSFGAVVPVRKAHVGFSVIHVNTSARPNQYNTGAQNERMQTLRSTRATCCASRPTSLACIAAILSPTLKNGAASRLSHHAYGHHRTCSLSCSSLRISRRFRPCAAAVLFAAAASLSDVSAALSACTTGDPATRCPEVYGCDIIHVPVRGRLRRQNAPGAGGGGRFGNAQWMEGVGVTVRRKA